MANKQMTLKNVIGVWPRFGAKGDRYGKQSIKLVFDKGSKADIAATAAYEAAKKEAGWVGDKAFIKTEKQSLRDGDLFISDKTGAILSGFEGKRAISATNREVLPSRAIVGRDAQPMNPADLSSGNLVNVIISFWTWTYEGTKMVNCQIDAVQKLEDGTPFTPGGDGVDQAVIDDSFKDLPPLEAVEMDPDALG